MRGHVHVVAGDITTLSCHAWLLPTDHSGYLSRDFRPAARAAGLDLDGRRLATAPAWGDTPVVRTPKKGPPAVWLGDVGADDDTPAAHFARVIDPFVRAAVDERLAGDEVPLLAIPALGTGHGGGAERRAEVLEALLTAAWDVTGRHLADLVLCCWQPDDYSAAQEVRRRLIARSVIVDPWGEGPSDADGAVKELVGHARAGRLVLFIGAGVSAGAGLPDWEGLLDDLARRVSDVDLTAFHRLDLRDRAAWLAMRSQVSLEADIVQRLQATVRPSLVHAHLASLPSVEAVTTNYDSLFETAVKGAGHDIVVMPAEPVRAETRWLMKLHGDLATEGTVVITRHDYLEAMSRNAALFGVLQALLLTRHMLFVGYSLRDDDFMQVMHQVRAARADVSAAAKQGTVLTLDDDRFMRDLWAQDFDVLPMAGSTDGGSVTAKARRLAILLDRIGAEAADVPSYVLDPAYASLLDDRDAALVGRLRELAASPELRHESGVATQVRSFLRHLGAEGHHRSRPT